MNAMLRTALRKFNGLLHQLEVNLLCDDGDTWETELKKFLRKEPCWQKVVKTTKTAVSKLLEFVTSVKVAEVKHFKAAEHFQEGLIVNGVKYYSSFGDNFNKHFLPKVEENVSAAELRVHKLLRDSKDLGIRTEIGEEKEETQLAYLHQCLKLQGNGEEGVLLTNGWANIFYIRDVEGNLWAVDAYWYVGGWDLNAFSVEYPLAWYADHQVFSR